MLQGIVHVLAAGAHVHLDAVPKGIVGLECRLGACDVVLLQRRDGVHQGRPHRLDAGDLEPLGRLCGFHRVGRSDLAEHCKCSEQTEADKAKLPAHTRRRCFSRDHCVPPSFFE